MLTCEIHSIPGFREPFSSISHLIAAFIFLCLSVKLVRAGRGSGFRVLSLIVFAFSTVFLLSMSSVYHMLPYETVGKEVMRRMDHAAIFVLIAGTFTPIHVILFKGWGRWGILSLVWAMAITGLCLKAILINQISEWMSLSFYLGLGWIGLYTAVSLYRRFKDGFTSLLIIAALIYTFGAIMEFLRWPNPIPGIIEAHELFHIAVIAGAAVNWAFISKFVSGRIYHRKKHIKIWQLEMDDYFAEGVEVMIEEEEN